MVYHHFDQQAGGDDDHHGEGGIMMKVELLIWSDFCEWHPFLCNLWSDVCDIIDSQWQPFCAMCSQPSLFSALKSEFSTILSRSWKSQKHIPSSGCSLVKGGAGGTRCITFKPFSSHKLHSHFHLRRFLQCQNHNFHFLAHFPLFPSQVMHWHPSMKVPSYTPGPQQP